MDSDTKAKLLSEFGPMALEKMEQAYKSLCDRAATFDETYEVSGYDTYLKFLILYHEDKLAFCRQMLRKKLRNSVDPPKRQDHDKQGNEHDGREACVTEHCVFHLGITNPRCCYCIQGPNG